jgi:hypothetical protein
MEKCKIKSCNNNHFDLLLCSYHYKCYAVDDNIKNKLSRIQRIIEKKANTKDKLIHRTYIIFYLITGINVPYVERFPLETVYIYFRNKIYTDKNLNFSINQFISNFDYEKNRELNLIKNDFLKIEKNLTDVKYFGSSKVARKNTIDYLQFLLMYLTIYFTCQIKDTKLENQIYFDNFSIFLVLSIAIIHSGIIFHNSTIDFVNKAISKKMFYDDSENKIFLKTVNKSLAIQKKMSKLLNTSLIIITFYNIRFCYRLIANNDFKFNSSIIAGLFLYAISWYLSLKIWRLLWVNSYTLSIVKILKSFKNYKFELYTLNRSLGIHYIKSFVRSVLVYNLIVIFAFFVLFERLNIYNDKYWVIFLILLSFLGIYINASLDIFRLTRNLKKQFRKLKEKELFNLSKSNSVSRITKYEFIEKLKLVFFYKKDSIKKFILYLIPFIISHLISEFKDEINSSFMKIIEYISNITKDL